MATIEPIDQIRDHLNLLGYRAAVDDIGLKLTHEGQAHFRMFKSFGGIGFLYAFDITKGIATDDLFGLLSLLNDVNEDCAAARFTYDSERDKLFVTSWYPNSYDPLNFGTFFDRLRFELAAPNIKFADAVQKYLTP